ncbi:unnamed protein product [Effrenium voratum]|uniref:Uncharacterized protein n=1 Tax=Effrenium voratum TaxID=2562239 RepID=A0AA36MY66_9DINO|nr:unnamed protein product [Effrenium voratum]
MEDGSEDAEAAAIGEGWARTLRELTLREGRSRRSEVVGTLPAGEEIFIASLIGMRAQVTSPRTGWISTSWEKQATVEALEVERTSPETNDDALSLADLPPIGPGWARTLVEANVREGRAKRSELRGALPAGSRVLIAEVRGPRAQLSQPYEGWISVVTAQQEPVLVQEEGPARKRSSSSEDAAKAPGAKAAALPPAKAKAPAQATPAAAPAKEAPKEPSSSSDSGSGSSDSSSDAARKPQASGALAMGAQVPPLPPGGPPEDEPPEDESSWRARGLGWWWTHQKAVVCKGESRLSEVLGAIPAGQTVFVQEIRAERAFIREPLQGWIPMASPRGHAILAAEAPATFPEPANAPEVEPEEAGRKLAEVELEEATPKALPGSLLLKKRQERRSEHEEKREAQALEQAEHGEEAAPRQETNAMLALRHSGRASAGVPGTLQRRPLVSLERSASARVQFSERPEPGKLQRRSERPAARVSEAEVQKDPAKAQEQTEATLIPGKLSAKLQERKAKTEQERREAEVAEARRREEARQLAEAAEAAEVAEAAEARKREARQREARQLAEAAEVAEVAEARRMEEATQLAEAADAAEVVEARRREEDRQQTEASEARRREEATQLAEAAEAAEVVEARRREEESEARRREEAKQLAEAADAAEVVEARRREEDRHQTEASEARRREEARQQSEASEARTREEATQLAEAADAAEVVEARRMEELEEQRRLAELAVVEKEEERQRAKAAEIRSDEERWSEQALAEDKLPAAQKQPGAAGNAQQETLESVLLLQGSPASTREDGLQGAETVGCAPGVSELPPALEHPKPMQEEELAVKTSMPASWQSEPSPSPSRERSRALSTGDLVHHAQPRGEATEAIATLEAMMLRVLHGPVPSFDPEPERRAPRAVGGAGSLAGRERGAKAGMPTFTRQPASRPAPRNQLEAPKPPEVEEEPLNEWWAIEKAESQRRLRALEARLEAAEAQAQEDGQWEGNVPMVNVGRSHATRQFCGELPKDARLRERARLCEQELREVSARRSLEARVRQLEAEESQLEAEVAASAAAAAEGGGFGRRSVGAEASEASAGRKQSFQARSGVAWIASPAFPSQALGGMYLSGLPLAALLFLGHCAATGASLRDATQWLKQISHRSLRVEEALLEVRQKNYVLCAKVFVHLTLVVVMAQLKEFVEAPNCCTLVRLLAPGAVYLSHVTLVVGWLKPTVWQVRLLSLFNYLIFAAFLLFNAIADLEAASRIWTDKMIIANRFVFTIVFLDTHLAAWGQLLFLLVNLFSKAINEGSSFIFMLDELSICCANLMLSVVLEALIRSRIQAMLDSADAESMVASFRRMLRGLCDGDLLLDSNLRIQGEAHCLKHLLFSSTTMQGRDFTELLAPSEQERFRAFLEAKAGETQAAPPCLRVSLRGSMDTRVSADVFRVPVAGLMGAEHPYHLLALKEDSEANLPEVEPVPLDLGTRKAKGRCRSSGSSRSSRSRCRSGPLEEMTLMLNMNTAHYEVEQAHLSFKSVAETPTLRKLVRPTDWETIRENLAQIFSAKVKPKTLSNVRLRYPGSSGYLLAQKVKVSVHTSHAGSKLRLHFQDFAQETSERQGGHMRDLACIAERVSERGSSRREVLCPEPPPAPRS